MSLFNLVAGAGFEPLPIDGQRRLPPDLEPVPVTLPRPDASPEEWADAVLAKLGYTRADVKAYKEAHQGEHPGTRMAAGFKACENTPRCAVNVKNTPNTPVPGVASVSKRELSELRAFLNERRTAPAPQAKGRPSDVLASRQGISRNGRAALDAKLNQQQGNKTTAALAAGGMATVGTLSAADLMAAGAATQTGAATGGALTVAEVGAALPPAAMIGVAVAGPAVVLHEWYKIARENWEAEQHFKTQGKPVDTAETIPGLETPTDEELPKGEVVKAAPAEPTVPPPAGGDEEPPQFDPKKIVPPIIGVTTAVTSKVLVDKLGQSSQTPVARVDQPGGRPDLRDIYVTDADVPAHYRNDPRFISLETDPDHAGKVIPKSRAEAMAGLEAETQGLIKAPIQRGPRGIEFYDAVGLPYDVKTPSSPKPGESWPFNPSESGKSILKELRTKATPPGAPAGTFPNGKTGQPELRRVILDSTYMSKADHQALWQWLNQHLTQEELGRIVEINTRL